MTPADASGLAALSAPAEKALRQAYKDVPGFLYFVAAWGH
jgi:hypothetical protein